MHVVFWRSGKPFLMKITAGKTGAALRIFRFCAKRRTKKAGFPQIATNQQCLIFFKLFRLFDGARLPLG